MTGEQLLVAAIAALALVVVGVALVQRGRPRR